jgi:hypothetical protein
MRLAKDEKQNLLGPLVVGSAFGAFAAFASLAFDADYGPHLYSDSPFSLATISAVHAVLAFGSVLGAVVLLFGVLPVVLPRVLARFRGSKDEHA